jgi:GTP-binding protein
MKIGSARFVKSATKVREYPISDVPEVAFAGRSNVGKSSLMNRLMERKNLVKVSGTPGKTRLLNFFMVNDAISLVDLPGYGYAKVSKSERDAWRPMIENYFDARHQLRALVCICDLRRGVEDDDLQLIESAPHWGFQPILVLTKADKFGKNAGKRQRDKVAKAINWPAADIVLFSSKSGLGRELLWERILSTTGAEPGA